MYVVAPLVLILYNETDRIDTIFTINFGRVGIEIIHHINIHEILNE